MRANVEVDEFKIVAGPGTTKLLEVMLELKSDSRSNGDYIGDGVPTTFTVVTTAGSRPVRVKVRICHLQADRSPESTPVEVYFSGIYENKLVDGVFDYKTQKGYFTEM